MSVGRSAARCVCDRLSCALICLGRVHPLLLISTTRLDIKAVGVDENEPSFLIHSALVRKIHLSFWMSSCESA